MITVENTLAYEIENRYPILWPISATVRDGKVTFSTYKELEEKLSFIEDMSEEELFKRETIDRIIGLIENEMEAAGYEISYGKNYIYKISRREDVNKALILDSSEVLLPDHGYADRLELQSEVLEDGRLCFATVIDGEVVSAAGENAYRENENTVNIWVESDEEFRNKGYGASNAAAVTYYLLDTGMTVSYTVDDENDASVRLAERIGFKRGSHVLDIIARKCDEGDAQE